MSNAKMAAVVGAGLVGLYLLSSQGKDGDGGGFGGGGGADREPGDTIIDFPELDLSSLWGDVGDVFEAKKTPLDPGVDYFQYLKSIGDLPTMGEEGDIMARSQFDISQYRTTTKKLTPDATTAAQPFSLSTWMKTHNVYGKLITPGPVDAVGKKVIPRQIAGGSSTRAQLKFYEYTKKGAHEGTLSRGRASPIKRLNV